MASRINITILNTFKNYSDDTYYSNVVTLTRSILTAMKTGIDTAVTSETYTTYVEYINSDTAMACPGYFKKHLATCLKNMSTAVNKYSSVSISTETDIITNATVGKGLVPVMYSAFLKLINAHNAAG